MNFLAHYYFDHKPKCPYYNLGLIFPDLVRNFVKGTKLNFDVKPANANALQLMEGCITHVASDKIFHQWDGFLQSMDRIIDACRQSDVEVSKDWFIAHILSELILDKELLFVDPSLAKQLYTDYSLVDIDVIRVFLEGQRLANFDQFQLGFERFLEHQYLESYTSPDRIVYALGKICTKMRLKPFNNQQVDLFVSIIANEGKYLAQEIDQLKDILK